MIKIDENTKHVVCLSGGWGSAKTALNVALRYGTKNLILLNHGINTTVEDDDIKRFLNDVSFYIGVPLTRANFKNMQDVELIPDQFDICISEKQMTTPKGDHICTNRLKTKPFLKWLQEKIPDKNCIIYYGFDKHEGKRVLRRSSILGALGFQTDYPNFSWKDVKYNSSEDVGIKMPGTYSLYEHANCNGCLKAGLLHWYVVYCTEIDIYRKGVLMEDEVGYYIHTIMEKGVKVTMSLRDLMPLFCQIKALGVKPTEHQNKIKFGRALKRLGLSEDKLFKPCECHT